MINFKIDRKASQKIVALALATTMTTSVLSGCSSKNSKSNILGGTILENSRVITFEDGHIDIAVANDNDYVGASTHEHHHYKSIITNEKFASSECDFKLDYKYEITNNESILMYLTPEEIAKATSEGLTNEDIKNIILRIFTEQEEMNKVKTK